MQKLLLSAAFALTLACGSAFTPSVAASAIDESMTAPVPTSDTQSHAQHAPIPWYMCAGKLKLCGPRHIVCGRC